MQHLGQTGRSKPTVCTSVWKARQNFCVEIIYQVILNVFFFVDHNRAWLARDKPLKIASGELRAEGPIQPALWRLQGSSWHLVWAVLAFFSVALCLTHPLNTNYHKGLIYLTSFCRHCNFNDYRGRDYYMTNMVHILLKFHNSLTKKVLLTWGPVRLGNYRKATQLVRQDVIFTLSCLTKSTLSPQCYKVIRLIITHCPFKMQGSAFCLQTQGWIKVGHFQNTFFYIKGTLLSRACPVSKSSY
jgi:hypothetical protein